LDLRKEGSIFDEEIRMFFHRKVFGASLSYRF
jgi:hypothetical protein